MKAGRRQGTIPLTLVIGAILAGTLVLSVVFYYSWQKLHRRVENIMRQQFNQQQLELARKIADNVEAYIDILENALLGYAGLFYQTPTHSQILNQALVERFERHKHFGILELRRYNPYGELEQALSINPHPPRPGSLSLLPQEMEWAKDPKHKGRLLLSKTYNSTEPSWQGRRVLRFLTPLYGLNLGPKFLGVMELLIDPFFVCGKVTEGVRSGETGYPWVIDQDGILLAHYEKDFVGQDAIRVRLARKPKVAFTGLRELQARLLQGEEGVTEYTSGWHRAELEETPKLAAYTPIRFDKGLIRDIIDVEDPSHTLWGVVLAAPVGEVSGNVEAVMHQELFLVGIFFLVAFLASGGLICVALIWNKMLSRQVELKTKELLESQERLVRSERFAAVGEAAAYVSHEIKNPLMVVGGLARQVERRVPDDPACQEKLQIIQNEVRRLENFLGDLRDFTRPALPVKQSLHLNQVIREVQALMELELQEKQVTLVSKLSPQLPELVADANQLKQILVNLFKNALEAMDGEGQITVASGAKDGQVWFSVQDTGAGMTPEVLGKIFNPFFTTKEKGTGLGLSVTHKIITDHHGTITVESAPGRGTQFTVWLPETG